MQIPASLRSDFIHIASEQSIHIVGIRNKFPKLIATQLSGPDEGPIEMQHMRGFSPEIMADQEYRKAVETMHFKMAELELRKGPGEALPAHDAEQEHRELMRELSGRDQHIPNPYSPEPESPPSKKPKSEEDSNRAS